MLLYRNDMSRRVSIAVLAVAIILVLAIVATRRPDQTLAHAHIPPLCTNRHGELCRRLDGQCTCHPAHLEDLDLAVEPRTPLYGPR